MPGQTHPRAWSKLPNYTNENYRMQVYIYAYLSTCVHCGRWYGAMYIRITVRNERNVRFHCAELQAAVTYKLGVQSHE